MSETSRPSSSRVLFLVLLLAVCLAAAGGGYWYLRENNYFGLGTGKADNREPAEQTPEQAPARTQKPVQTPEQSFPRSPSGLAQPEIPATQAEAKTADEHAHAAPETGPENEAPPDSARQAVENEEPADEPDAAALAGHNGTRANEPAATDEKKTGQQDSAAPLPSVIYGQGRAVTPEGNVVRGDVPDVTAAIDTKRIFDAPGGQAEDGILGTAFIDDFARFLVQNYWPVGTHPGATQRAVTTADIKWANLKYGGHFDAFPPSGELPQARRQTVLRYILMPSMVKSLYRLYVERLVAAMTHEALDRPRELGGSLRPLTKAETARMFGLYADRAKALAETIRAYLADSRNRELVLAYLDSEKRAYAAQERHALAAPGVQAVASREYQEAVVRREQARERIASALRKGGNTRGLDTESLVFIAQWLHRRQGADNPGLPALAQVLDACALRLEQEQKAIEAAFHSTAKN